MEVYKNDKIKETVYTEVLDNGMKIIIIPKTNTRKKYIIWATKFGSIDNHFIEPKTKNEIKVPDGVAHYLEHKMFENENGIDSLYKMMALGLDANAYTTNDHTAFLFGCVDNFYEGLDELMNYVQKPYFTDENVEKERGIIGQEIGRYDDEPAWKLYVNAMDCLYKTNPVKLDIAGTVESISKITKEVLYSCYNTFYHPSNMIMCISGNFEPKEIIEEVKKRLIPKEKNDEIKRIYPEETKGINKNENEVSMGISMPTFMIGYKDELNEDKVKTDLAIQIIFNSLLGKSSKLYQELYSEGLIISELDTSYEYSKTYAHALIAGESKKPRDVYEKILDTMKNASISKEDFERSKKKIYGDFVTEYNDVEDIGRMYLTDAIKDVNSMDYIDKIDEISLDYVNDILKRMFKENKSIISIVK